MLGAVWMVNIPVDNEHALSAVFSAGIFSGDGHIVKQAKTHLPVMFSMMSGRAPAAKTASNPACNNRINCRTTLPAAGKLPRRNARS